MIRTGFDSNETNPALRVLTHGLGPSLEGVIQGEVLIDDVDSGLEGSLLFLDLFDDFL